MEVAETVGQHWFFKSFTPEELKLLLAKGQQVFFPAGSKILQEGKPAESFYILLAGAVSIKIIRQEHEEFILSTLKHPGEIFGWSTLVEEGRFTATAECLEDCRLISFKRKDLEDFFAEHPQLGYQFMRSLARLISRRLESTRALLFKEIS
ncbi:MAG: Crp/Fnr family transcriptional regulator [Thermodesulfobacteriota bacterium]